MTKRQKMQGLKRLTAAKLLAERTRYAQYLAKEDRLRRNLEQLVKDRHRKSPPAGHLDPAFAAGADVRWHQWVDARRTVINTELARVLALKSESQRSLQRAFGKDQALDTLLRNQRDALATRRRLTGP